MVMKSMEGKLDLTEPWNLSAARSIRNVVRGLKIFLVGGIRDTATMERILKNGDSDFIQMCRPFVREPFLVKKIRKGETDKASCRNCNRCLGAIANNIPIACYYNGLPA